MINEVKVYRCVCDNCGAIGGIDQDLKALKQRISDQSWHTTFSELGVGVGPYHYCPECHFFNDRAQLVIRADRGIDTKEKPP